jgi:hypothetical protein
MLNNTKGCAIVDPESSEELPRIYSLIEKAIATPDSDEFEAVMSDLREVLKEHIRRLRETAAVKLAPGLRRVR